MRRANIATISLLIVIIEPGIWRLRQGSKEILHRCFRAFPGARAGSGYIGKAPRAHPVRPRHSCNGATAPPQGVTIPNADLYFPIQIWICL